MNPYTGKNFKRVINEKDYAIVKRRLEKGQSIERISAYTGISEKNLEFIKAHPQYTGYKNLDKLKALVEPYAFYIRKEECFDLPPKIYEKIIVEFNPEQKKIYQELVKMMLAYYDTHELTVQNKLSLTLRLMQVCGGFFPSKELKKPVLIGAKNAKIERLKQDLEEIADEKVIIWSHFVAEIEMLTTELKKAFPQWRVETYYGKTEKTKRQQLITEFKAGRIKLLIANQQTASVGLNLQRSNLHYFYSNSYSLDQRVQAEDRSHRHGQQWPVVYKDLIMRDSVEVKVLEVLKNKRNLLDYFRDKSLKEILGVEEQKCKKNETDSE
jgi:SNF2 family DNA or RNA helicase